MPNSTNGTYNLTEFTIKPSSSSSAGELILVIFLALLGSGVFGVVVYIAIKRIRYKPPAKNRAIKYLDNSISHHENNLNSKKNSLKISDSSKNKHIKRSLSESMRETSNKNSNSEFNKKGKSLSKKDKELKKFKTEKETDKNSTDSHNSINANFKIVSKSPFIQETDRNDQLVNSCQKNIFKFNLDKNNDINSNEKINIFSHYNSILKNNHNAVIKGKNKNAKSKNSLEANGNKNTNKNNNTGGIGTIVLNLNEFSKIKISRKFQENLEEFNKNLNNDYDNKNINNNKNVNENDNIKLNKNGELDKSQDKSDLRIMNESVNSNTRKINVDNLQTFGYLESQKNQNNCYTNSSENLIKLESDENRIAEQASEIVGRKSKYEFKIGAKKIKKSYEKESLESSNKTNLKIPTGLPTENKVSGGSNISKTNNLIKVNFLENCYSESRNINNGLITNLNSSKYSEFEEKILEIGDEFIENNIQGNAYVNEDMDNSLNYISSTKNTKELEFKKDNEKINNFEVNNINNTKINNSNYIINENSYLNIKLDQKNKEFENSKNWRNEAENLNSNDSNYESKYKRNRKINSSGDSGDLQNKNSNDIFKVKLDKNGSGENEILNSSNDNDKNLNSNYSSEAALKNFL